MLQVVRDRSLLRGLIKAGTAIAASAYDTSADVPWCLMKLSDLECPAIDQSYTDVLVDAFEHLIICTNKGGTTMRPDTRLGQDHVGFNHRTWWCHRRPAWKDVCTKYRGVVFLRLYSAARPKEQLARECSNSVAGVDGQRLRTGFVRDDDIAFVCFGQTGEPPQFC